MSSTTSTYIKFGAVICIIVGLMSFLAWTGVQENKDYYVTIRELKAQASSDAIYRKHLRVAGNVVPGSISRKDDGGGRSHVEFVLVEKDPKTGAVDTVAVSYQGLEPPPDTFKDDAQALAVGSYGRDGVFHAKQIQAKCASKYAPKPADGTVAPTGQSTSM